jgi:hypothetical protein
MINKYVPILITKFILVFYPKKIRAKYSNEIFFLVEQEYKMRSCKTPNFWVWLISDFVVSLINFYVTEGDEMKENNLIKQSMIYFMAFGLYFILKTFLLNLNFSFISLNLQRILRVASFYSDIIVFTLLFISVIGFSVILKRNNLLVGIVLCVPIFTIIFGIKYPYIANFDLYFISIGMVVLGGYLYWTRRLNNFRILPFLLTGSPVVLLINFTNSRSFTFYLVLVTYSLFGLGWIFIGKHFLENINQKLTAAGQ